MSVNKVILGENTLIDLSEDTVTSSDHILEGRIAHLADGSQVEGTLKKWIIEGLDDDLTGLTVLYEAENLEFDGTNYELVDIALFSEQNINKDFKIILQNVRQDNSIGTGGTGERCLLGAMYEVKPWPGIVVRVGSGSGIIGLSARYTYPSIIIKRINGTISAQGLNLSTYNIKVGSMTETTTTHNTPITLGCELDANGTPYRFTAGSIGKIIIAMSD